MSVRKWAETIINPYFIFQGIDSRVMGVIVTSMPEVVKPKKRVELVEIAGRSGVLHIDDDSFENYTKTIECAIQKRKKIDEICAWLNGEGELILSTEPEKKYMASIYNQISISKMMNVFQKFQINFDVYPFKYSVNDVNDVLELKQTPVVVYGKGTIFANPIITIYGTGSVTLAENGSAYTITNISEFVTIDSEMMEVFKNGVSWANYYTPPQDINKNLFPILEIEKNTISWTGNVDKIVIQSRWRWL